jgi:hypothetical protein
MGVVREDSGKKSGANNPAARYVEKRCGNGAFALEVSKNNPPLKFVYGKGKDAEQMSPAENLRRRKKGGTPVKQARQRVIARCVRELFKELCSMVTLKEDP